MSKVGIGVQNGPGDIWDMLNLGECGWYLICDSRDGVADFQMDTIHNHYPNAQFIDRRIGGMGTDPGRLAEEWAPRLANLHTRFGVRFFQVLNESDIEELWPAGTTNEQKAQVVTNWMIAFGKEWAFLGTGVDLLFPPWSGDFGKFFEDPVQDIWLKGVAAAGCKGVALHVYGDQSTSLDVNIDHFCGWAESRVIEGRLPSDIEIHITETNWGNTGNKPANYGDQLFRGYDRAYGHSICKSVEPFIWVWFNMPDTLNLRGDNNAQDGIRRAIALTYPIEPVLPPLTPSPEPTPPPVEPPIVPPPADERPPLDRAFALFGDIYNRADNFDNEVGGVADAFAEIQGMALDGQRAIEEYKKSVGL